MLYDIRLTIAHKYDQPADHSRHLIRVLPRSDGQAQRVTAHLIEILPYPAERYDVIDFFGNAVTSINHTLPHDAMEIRLSCRVEVFAPPPFFDISAGVGDLGRELVASTDLSAGSPMHFLGTSPLLRPNAEITDFAFGAVNAQASSASQVIQLGQALHAVMAFDPEATTVETDPLDAFRQRGGVCQDFTHIMILGLRALGIPAGYVSGYLRTLPPPGGVRLEGADAMHAWVRAWCGAAQGWIEYDPTNATLASTDHIVVGYGRDYSDVSPVIGHLRAAGGQKNTQSVDVRAIG
ncbi:transglutaminase family protein [Pseudooceanicola sp.]|uniref:transglutaminase family protein n=1 Tax=Pseudooceanicola sp. TaxID=1914328 RepID=UPI002617BEDF|nr:transglutaminase family protein [Pseudooceanicola sp.]MDF1853876.1 transglutaminase family protein [Pseudooceanicola sp.]